jgi:hypothetical protein
MQIRLLVSGLALTLMLGLVLVFSGSAFVEQTVSAATDNRSATESANVQTSPCADGKESGAECSGNATALLPDVEPADKGDANRELETANCESDSGVYSALSLVKKIHQECESTLKASTSNLKLITAPLDNRNWNF